MHTYLFFIHNVTSTTPHTNESPLYPPFALAVVLLRMRFLLTFRKKSNWKVFLNEFFSIFGLFAHIY